MLPVLLTSHLAALGPILALTGATLLDGIGGPPVGDAVVLVRGGRIECAGDRAACPIPADAEVKDLRGHWITPGLVDAHVHFSQTGWADGRPDSIDVRDLHPYEKVQASLRTRPERFFRSYLCSGVTAVFDVGGYPWTWDLRGRAEGDPQAPHVEAAGPLISTIDFWLNLPAERQFIYLADEKAGREGVRYLAAGGAAAVKVWFIVSGQRPFEEMAAAVAAGADETARLGVPLIVHATGLREAKEALKAGARLLVHSVWDQPVDDEFIRLALEKKTIYCPTLVVRDGYRRMFASALSGRPPEVDDPGGCVDPETLAKVAETARLGADRLDPGVRERLARGATQSATAAENLKRVHAAGIPVAMGTDAGNPLTLHGPSVYAEMEAMEAAGLPPMEVLAAATRGGALAMGRAKDLGTVEAGKIADLLVVAADPAKAAASLRQVRFVMRAGVLHRAEDLKAARP